MFPLVNAESAARSVRGSIGPLPVSFVGLVLVMLWPLPCPAAATPLADQPLAARALSKAFAATVRAVRASVVRVDVVQERVTAAPGEAKSVSRPSPGDASVTLISQSRPQGKRVKGNGSGIIVDERGFVVTSRHVVHEAVSVKITLHDGRVLDAKVVGADRRSDLALLRLVAPPPDLVRARLGDAESIEVGEWVMALGCPLGLGPMVTVGILSGRGVVGRKMGMTGDRVREYLQTDAKINPGNSGGPLVNLDGEVIGINTLIRSGSGGSYGFAVPVAEVKRVTAELLETGVVRTPFLGLYVRDVASLDPGQRALLKLPDARGGALVSNLVPAGPAARAGLRPGDVVIELDGKSVHLAEELRVRALAQRPGTYVPMVFVRNGKRLVTRVGLVVAPPNE